MGKAQSRYLWILLITMIFYGALPERLYVDTDPLKMPIVDVEISGPFVLGFGPALISFFVLAVTGSNEDAMGNDRRCRAVVDRLRRSPGTGPGRRD
jgi:hypothetical protein